MKNRIVFLDRIKGFTILLMVLAHVYMAPMDMHDSMVFRVIGSFHMHLFMFISGFVAFIPYECIEGYNLIRWRKRFFAYLCPAFTVGYFITLFRYILIGEKDIDVATVLSDGAWYLKCMAIFCTIQFVMLNFKKVWMEFAFLTVIWSLFLLGWKQNGLLLRIMALEHCTVFFPYFILGYYVRRWNMVDYVRKYNWIFTIATIGYLCTFFYTPSSHLVNALSYRVVTPIFAIVSIVYLFMTSESRNTIFDHWLEHLGKRTLDIYIYHGFFILGAFSLDLTFVKQTVGLSTNPIFCLIIAITVSVLIVYISIGIGQLVRTSHLMRMIIYGDFFDNTSKQLNKTH